MAQEGIATLPQSQPVDNPAVDLDATKNAVLGQVGPEAMSAYEQGMDQASQGLNLPPDQLQLLLQVLEMILKDPSQYAQIRQKLLQAGLSPEDLPEEFDGGYFTTMLVMVKEALKRSQGQSPTAQGPMPQMPEQPTQGFAAGGLAGAAESLRQKGRTSDSILAHINPQEAMILQAMGGRGTINPATGLPEFGLWEDIKKPFTQAANTVKNFVASPVGKIISTVALTYLTAGMGVPLVAAAGISAGAVSLAGGSNLKTALMSGLLAAGTAYIAPTISSYMPGATGSFLNAAATGGVLGAGFGLVSGQSPQNALKMGLTGAAVGGGLQYLGANMPGSARSDGGAPVTDNSAPWSPDNIDTGGVQQMPSINEQSSLITQQGGALTPSSEGISTLTGGGTNLQAPVSLDQQYMNQDMAPQARTGAGIFTGEGQQSFATTDANSYGPGWSAKGFNPSAAELATTGQAPGSVSAPPPKTGGVMDYVPDFFKSADGSLSVPAVTAGVLGVGALTGGFKTSTPNAGANSTVTGIQRDSSGKPVTGTDLVNQNPNQYIVGNIPGFNAPAPSPTQAGLVESPMYGNQRLLPYANYTPPPNAVTGRPGQVIQQPYNTASMYTFLPQTYAQGGISQAYPRRTGGISGPGTGTSDSIPAMLSDGEFVITAKAVRGAGNGSRREGAKKLYRMMHALEKKAKK